MGANEFFASLRFFYPISILYFSSITGDYTTAMGVFSFATITMALLEVPTGILSDKWGRKPLLVTGCILEFLSTLTYGFAGFSFLLSGTLWLYIGGGLFGVAGALFSGNNYALLYETSENIKQIHKIPHIIGRNASMEQVGLAIASAIGALLLWQDVSFQMLVLLTLFPMALTIITASLITEPPKHSISESKAWNHMKTATNLLFTNKDLRLLAFCSSWKSGWLLSSHSFMPKFIETLWPLWAVPLYRVGQNIVGAGGYWVAGKICDKLSPLKTLIGTSFLSDLFSLIAYGLSNIFSPFFSIYHPVQLGSRKHSKRNLATKTIFIGATINNGVNHFGIDINNQRYRRSYAWASCRYNGDKSSAYLHNAHRFSNLIWLHQNPQE